MNYFPFSVGDLELQTSGMSSGMSSTSVRTQISTREDGTVEEHRTTITIGPTGEKNEKTETIIHENSEPRGFRPEL